MTITIKTINFESSTMSLGVITYYEIRRFFFFKKRTYSLNNLIDVLAKNKLCIVEMNLLARKFNISRNKNVVMSRTFLSKENELALKVMLTFICERFLHKKVKIKIVHK